MVKSPIVSFLFLTIMALGCQTTTREAKAPLPPGTSQGSGPVIDPSMQSGLTSSQPVYLGEDDPTLNGNVPFGLIELTNANPSWIIARPQYVMSWNPSTHNINWAAWKMDATQLGTRGRQDAFTSDPLLRAYVANHPETRIVTSSDYTGFCFDRGHQVASGDRQGSDDDNKATFYTSNIIPQTAFLNQIIWRKLEDSIKDWIRTETYKNLWVVAGPIYGSTLSFTGPHSDIAVPKYNFKAVFSWDENTKDKPSLVKAVIMPNVVSNGDDPETNKDMLCKESRSGGHSRGIESISEDIDSYLATIPAIEAAAHIKFPVSAEP